jgi:hypothetical protein
VVLRVILGLIPIWFMGLALRADKQFTLAAQRRVNGWALKHRQFAVLYLRAFDFDRSEVRDDEITGFSSSDEQDIVSALAPAGPVVALADPRWSSVVRGAIRLSVQPDDWQDRVRGLLGQVRLVAIVAATSPSVLWEITQAAKLAPERLVLLIPESMTGDAYRAFRTVVNPLLVKPLPRVVPAPSALAFDSARSPKILARSRWQGSWAAILAPIVRRLRREAPAGSPHPRRPTRWHLRFELAMMITLATVALIVTKLALGIGARP